MFVAVCCPRCQRPLRVRESYQGRRTRCPGCARDIRVPLGSSVELAPLVVTDTPVASMPTVAPPLRSRKSLAAWSALVPAILGLGVLAWLRQDVLWAALGVGLGSLCLLVSQRRHWPISLGLGLGLALALLGYGLTWAEISWKTHRDAPQQQIASAPVAEGTVPSPPPPPPRVVTKPMPGSGKSRRTALGPSPEPAIQWKRSEFQSVAKLGELLALAIAPNAQGQETAYVSTVEGQIKAFSYPQFELKATYALEKPAYRLLVAGSSPQLWMATDAPQSLRRNRYGDRTTGRGDLVVFDLPRSQTGAADALAQPRHELSLTGELLELLVAPDRKVLYYLLRGRGGSSSIGRIDAEQHTVERETQFVGKLRTLGLTPDGKTLYAAGESKLLVLDPVTLNVRRRVDVEADVFGIAANNQGKVFLSEQGQWTDLTCLDLRDAQPVSHPYHTLMHGRIYVKMASDQARLYVGTSSPISNHLDVLLLRDRAWHRPPLVGMTIADEGGPVQGEFFLTPDDQFLVNRWGRVFRLAHATNPPPQKSVGGIFIK